MTTSKLAIIQARMSSSRLPGKVMMDIAGKPMIQQVIERTMQAKSVDSVVLATTTDPSDDVLQKLCRKLAIACYRGSLHDVLDRFYRVAAQFHPDAIIRLTADCPLIDPSIIDLTVRAFLGEFQTVDTPTAYPIPDNSLPIPTPFDFVASRLPPPWKRTLPIGLDVEVCSFTALERAWREADQLYQREHVMPFLYEGVKFIPSSSPSHREWYLEAGTTPRQFKVALLNHYPDYGSLRWTVDTRPDLEFVRQVYARFEGQSMFSWTQVLSLLEKEPGLAAINADVEHKTAFDVDRHSPTK